MDCTDMSSDVRRCPDHGTRSKRVPIRQVLSSGVKRVDASTVYDPHFIRLIDDASVQYLAGPALFRCGGERGQSRNSRDFMHALERLQGLPAVVDDVRQYRSGSSRSSYLTTE